MTLTIYETLEQGTGRLPRAAVRNFKEPYIERAKRRFLKFVPILPDGECWEWQSVRNKRGYGKFWFYGKTDLAHRVSYELFNGPIPDDFVVRHACDNPPCVNPEHLSTGTLKDNARDALERGRYPRGEKQGRAKLTAESVTNIRFSRAQGETQKALAERHGVSIAAVQFVLNGRNWAGIGDHP